MNQCYEYRIWILSYHMFDPSCTEERDFICGDGSPTANALGIKLFIKRPGCPQILPSFNYGLRIKSNMKDWSPC